MRLLAAVVLALATWAAIAQPSVVRGPVGVSQNATYTGTAGTTSTFPPGPNAVLVWCSTACFVKVGEGVTATTSDVPLPGNVLVWLPVPPGTGAPWRVSAIQQSSGGSVFAQPTN